MNTAQPRRAVDNRKRQSAPAGSAIGFAEHVIPPATAAGARLDQAKLRRPAGVAQLVRAAES